MLFSNIDILDEAASVLQLQKATAPNGLRELLEEQKNLECWIQDALEQGDFVKTGELAAWQKKNAKSIQKE